MNRLTGWQRIGIVLSILWGLGVLGLAAKAYYEYSQEAAIEASNAECLDNARKAPSAEEKEKACGVLPPRSEASAQGRTQRSPVPGFLALLLLPIVVSWLLVYVGMWTTRWVRAGFNPKRRREDIKPPTPEGRRARKPASRL